MKKHKHNIIWEKWEDPFELKEDYGNDLEHDVTEEEYNQLVSEIEKSYQEQEQQQEQQSQQYRFILTPFGLLLIISCFLLLKIFGTRKDVPPFAQSITNFK